MYGIKAEDVYEDFNNDKGMYGFSNFLTESKWHNYLNKLVVGKLKNETSDVGIGEFNHWNSL